MPDPEEVQLIERCRRGEERAFQELVERYQRRVYWIAHNMLHSYEYAQDIAQQAFVRVFRNLERFDTSRNFYTWLYQIVVNLCIDHMRKSHVKTADLEVLGGVEDDKPGPSERMGRSEVQERVHRTLDRLPPKYKAVLALRDIQGFSCEEIAEVVGATNATVRWRLHRARKLFQAAWEGKSVALEDGDENAAAV
jgi:RNA polymerase sigma-70 factor (ECF subfamily)